LGEPESPFDVPPCGAPEPPPEPLEPPEPDAPVASSSSDAHPVTPAVPAMATTSPAMRNVRTPRFYTRSGVAVSARSGARD
jgi:hypothetical protein